MGAEKLKAQVQGDTANWRSIKSEENKACMEPACEKKYDSLHMHGIYAMRIHTSYVYTHTQSLCAYTVLNVCTHLHTNAHPYT